MDEKCKVCGETNEVDEGTIFYTCVKCLDKKPKPWGKFPPIISWERIRKVLQEQTKKNVTDNMFRMEAIAKAQRDDDVKFYEAQDAKTASIKDAEIKKLQEKIHTTNVYYLREIQNNSKECQTRIGALIEEALKVTHKYWSQYCNIRDTKSCLEILHDIYEGIEALKGEAIKRNTSEDPEEGME